MAEGAIVRDGGTHQHRHAELCLTQSMVPFLPRSLRLSTEDVRISVGWSPTYPLATYMFLYVWGALQVFPRD